jgi:hypothetical protein
MRRGAVETALHHPLRIHIITVVFDVLGLESPKNVRPNVSITVGDEGYKNCFNIP